MHLRQLAFAMPVRADSSCQMACAVACPRSDPAMRFATSGAAVAGLAVWACLGLVGPMAPWGLVGATIFLGDLWAAWALPDFSVQLIHLPQNNTSARPVP